jgi:hypothetical protein
MLLAVSSATDHRSCHQLSSIEIRKVPVILRSHWITSFVQVGLPEIRQACGTDVQTCQLRNNHKSNYRWCYKHLQILIVLVGPEQPFQSLSSAFILSTLLQSNSWYRQTNLLQNVNSGMTGKSYYCLSVFTSHAGRVRGKGITSDSCFSAHIIQ